ncbi:hypothetical protein VTO42DRAFT_6655 [Malbranchea cinnamomea]
MGHGSFGTECGVDRTYAKSNTALAHAHILGTHTQYILRRTAPSTSTAWWYYEYPFHTTVNMDVATHVTSNNGCT